MPQLCSIAFIGVVRSLLLLGFLAPTAVGFSAPAGKPESQRFDQLLFEGRYQAAHDEARELLTRREQTLGPDSLAVAEALDMLVRVHLEGSTGNLDTIRTFAERAVRIRETESGPAHPRLAKSMVQLSIVLSDSDEPNAARSLLEAALAMQQSLLAADHPDVASSLDELGILQMMQGDLAGADPRIVRALQIRSSHFGPNHAEVAESLMSLGVLQLYRGQYEDARKNFESALEIRQRYWGPDHPKVAGSAHNLGIALQSLGDVRGARAQYERALEIRSHVQPADYMRLGRLHIVTAGLCQTQGDYAGAIVHLRAALQLQEDYLDEDHTEIAITLVSLAHFLQASGARQEALGLLERAARIREQAWGPNHPGVASSWTRLGWMHLTLNDRTRAASYFERALAVQRAAVEPRRDELAQTLLGSALSLRPDQMDRAETLLTEALEIYETTYGRDYPGLATVLGNLAEHRYTIRDYNRSVEAFDRALNIARKLDNADRHPLVARLLHGKARALGGLGLNAEALESALASAAIHGAHLEITARVLPERHALAYASISHENLDVVFTLMGMLETAPDVVVREAWDALVHARGVVLDEMATRQRFLQRVTDPIGIDLAESVQVARQQLANLLVSAPADWNEIARLRLAEEAQQRELAEYSAEFRQLRTRAKLGFQQVSEQLPEDWALVAYTKYNRYDPLNPARSSIPAYVAFVQPPDRSSPVFVDIGAASQVETSIAEWRSEASDGVILKARRVAEADYRRVGRELRRRVWDPVAPYLDGAKRILIVPDGALNLVSFSALPTGSDSFLLETEPPIHLLALETDLISLEEEIPTGKGLLALGGADFDATSLFAALRLEQEATPVLSAGTLVSELRPFFRGPRATCPEFSSVQFDSLPATEKEIREISTLWRESTRRSAVKDDSAVPVVLTHSSASESAFKRLAPGRQVLHLATHGFFLGEDCASRPTSFRGLGGLSEVEGDTRPDVQGVPALVLSGLVLAGANHRNVAGPDEDDGILTAEEIATLNLEGVEWVVLSACKTGVGLVQAGEGVFGLRRAFSIAGARTLVMSLWALEDESTREWMSELYDGRLNRGMDTAEAVRHASLSVLRRRRAEGLTTHPLYWGGLVAVGDWR